MVKIRENVVFIISEEIESAEYVPNSLVATKGQPTEEPVEVDVTEGVVTTIVQSGRKKSKPIANKFKKESSNFYMTTQGGGKGSPHELNFMFSLKVRFKDGREVVVNLGQGNRSLVRNNWWLGSAESINPYTVEPSSLEEEGFDIGEALKGLAPTKWEGLVTVVDELILKDLVKEVNVFKIK